MNYSFTMENEPSIPSYGVKNAPTAIMNEPSISIANEPFVVWQIMDSPLLYPAENERMHRYMFGAGLTMEKTKIDILLTEH